MIRFTLFLLLLWATGLAAQEAGCFGLGEKICFKVGWGPVNAGKAELEVVDTLSLRGSRVWQIESRARSNRTLSILYPVRDRVITYMDRDGYFSHGIQKYLREGGYSSDRIFEFDYPDQMARRYKQEAVSDSVRLTTHVQDVLSAFYWVRTQPLEVGRTLQVEAMDDLKTYRLAVQVLAREKVKVKAGTFECFLVQPLLMGEGLFKTKGEVYIWITADERRIPVKMRSEIFIGAISAVMTDYQPGHCLEAVLP